MPEAGAQSAWRIALELEMYSKPKTAADINQAEPAMTVPEQNNRRCDHSCTRLNNR